MAEPSPIQLYSVSQGDPRNPVIVILHGLFGSHTNWRGIARTLADHYHVVCLDLRNHGASPWATEMDYAVMAADVAETIHGLGLSPPVLLGHSMGGKTAMAVAQLQLAPLAGLIIADIAPVTYRHDHEEFIAAMRSVDTGGLTRRAEADERLAESIDSPGIRQFLLQNLVREDGGYRWRINLDVIQHSMPALLDWSITSPTGIEARFIYGENSNYVRDDGREAIKRFYQHAGLTPIADAGHWLHAEQPVEFVAAVRTAMADMD